MPDAPNRKPPGAVRSWFELAGFWAIAVAWPTYQFVNGGPEALTGLGIRVPELLAFIAVVSFAAPTLMLGIERLVGLLSRNGSRILHAAILGAMVGLFVWHELQESASLVRYLLPLLAWILFSVVYLRTEFFRNFAAFMSIAAPAVIVLFVVAYPINTLFLPGEEPSATETPERQPPIVIVLFDELPSAALLDREGRIDRRYFPNLSEFAGQANWYRRALSVADHTLSAAPAILTGQTPPDSATRTEPLAPNRHEYPDSICSVAERAGYEVFSHELVTDFCGRQTGFLSRLAGLLRQATPSEEPRTEIPGSLYIPPAKPLTPGRALERVTDGITSLADEAPAPYGPERPADFRNFVEEMPVGEATLSVIHIALPHVDYEFTEDGKLYKGRWAGDTEWSSELSQPTNAAEAGKNLQQLTAQMMFTDRLLGELITRLKREGTWDESLVVVVADHGASFRLGAPRRRLTAEGSGWLLPVPLLVKLPNQTAGRIVDSDADIRDVTPTVVDALGLEPLPRASGTSLLKRGPGGESDLTALDIHRNRVDLEKKTVLSALRSAVAQRNRLFGEGELYAIGGHASLIGSRPETGRLKQLPAIPIPESDLSDVDPSSPESPAYYEAALPGVKRDPGPIAVALNGRIVATTRAWQRGAEWRTGTNLPTARLNPGTNEVTIFAIGRNPRESAQG